MHMRIHRFVLATIGADSISQRHFINNETGINIQAHRVTLNRGPLDQDTLLFDASCEARELPETNDEIEIPVETRRSLESEIEYLIGVLSLKMMNSFQLSSPTPYIAIEGLNEETRQWLNGKIISVNREAGRTRIVHDLDWDSTYKTLGDRRDGVALLAEAISHQHPTGKLHEFMRVFERAFSLSAGKVCRGPLANFLEPSGFNFDQCEVDLWLRLRDSTAHADRKQRFSLRSDTNIVVSRVEQAAFDVLFNKQVWNDPSLERRNLYYPICGPADSTSGIFIQQGKAPRITVSMYDGFFTYPLNLKAKHTLAQSWVIH